MANLGKKWVAPEGHRVSQEVAFCSDFAGIAPWCESASTMGVGKVKLTSEANPWLRERLQREQPQAEHLEDTKRILEAQFRDELDLLFSSPICTQHTQVNLFRKGADES